MVFVSAGRLTAMPACGKLGASGRKIHMCFFCAFCFIASCASSRRLASSCCKVMPQGLSLLDATISANFRTVTRCGSKMMRIISCRIYLIAVNALTLLFNACRFRFRNTPYNCAQTIHVIPADQNFEKKRSSSALFAHEINLVTQPSFDCEQGINSQVQTACSNADAIFPVLGIVSCRNERFSLSRKTHVPLWNEPRISHVRLL